MPSTHTNIGVEKIGIGEQSGSWGNAVNANMDLLDEAIAGVASISLTSTSYQLSVADGESSEGRHKVLVFSGTPGGECKVTVGPNTLKKTYIVANRCDAAIRLTQGSGGDVVVAAGAQVLVFCDGGGNAAQVSAIEAAGLAAEGTTASLHARGAGQGGQMVTTFGARALGDGGGGRWYWSETQDKASANYGTVVDPSVAFSWAAQGTGQGQGCWLREFSGPVKVRWFGVVGDGVTDDTEALKKIFAYVNNDAFTHTFQFPKLSSPARGIGLVKAVELNAEDVYGISDTLDMSTNVQLIGNGAAFKMLAAGAGKTMLRIRYFKNPGFTSFGTQFNAITNIKLDGAEKALYGLVCEKTNWTNYHSIFICACTGYGLVLDACQYSTFVNVYADGNHNGMDLGTTGAGGCVDLTFIGCGAHGNRYVGLHASDMSNCLFSGLDAGRNGEVGILFDDVGVPSGQTHVIRQNTFERVKFEYAGTEVPSSGYAININTKAAYSNSFNGFIFAQQQGAYYKLVRNIGRYNVLNDPKLTSLSAALTENPAQSGDFSLFECAPDPDGVGSSLRVNFRSWAPKRADLGLLAVGPGNGPLASNASCVISVIGNYVYFSEPIVPPV